MLLHEMQELTVSMNNKREKEVRVTATGLKPVTT